MHILYHHRTAGDRVEAVHIMGMVRALRKLGHTVEISSPPGCDPEHKKAAMPAAAPAVPSGSSPRDRLKRFARRGHPVFFEAAELLYNFYSLYDMTRRARSRRPDMIIERSTSNSIVPTALGRWWNIPVVQEVNVTTGVGRLRSLELGDLTRRIERWVFGRAALLMTVSEEFKRLLVASGQPAEKIIVCQNAIDPDDFPSSPSPEEDGSPVVVGYVGAFVPWHRPDMLVESASLLEAEYPRTRWLLVGDGVERPAVERLVGERNLAGSFEFPGAVPHSRVAEYVSKMDIAVMPHSNPHGSPMKLFEYMAAGRAVVAPDFPAIREVIRHGRNGLLFPAGDTKALTEAIRRLIDDVRLRREVGAQARKDVLQKHTWSHNAESLLGGVERRRKDRVQGMMQA